MVFIFSSSELSEIWLILISRSCIFSSIPDINSLFTSAGLFKEFDIKSTFILELLLYNPLLEFSMRVSFELSMNVTCLCDAFSELDLAKLADLSSVCYWDDIFFSNFYFV